MSNHNDDGTVKKINRLLYLIRQNDSISQSDMIYLYNIIEKFVSLYPDDDILYDDTEQYPILNGLQTRFVPGDTVMVFYPRSDPEFARNSEMGYVDGCDGEWILSTVLKYHPEKGYWTKAMNDTFTMDPDIKGTSQPWRKPEYVRNIQKRWFFGDEDNHIRGYSKLL